MLSGLWELPFGPGRPLFTSSNPIVKRITSGWQFSWISTFQTGQALAITDAERVSDTNADKRVYTEWFDRSQFIARPAFTLKRTSSRIAQFTRITGTALNPRNIQISGRISF